MAPLFFPEPLVMAPAIRRLSAPLVLVVSCIATYWPGLAGDLFFDSIPNIGTNEAVQITKLTPQALLAAALSYPTEAIGRPLPMMSFALDWYVAGPNPRWFKAVNLLIHTLNAVLVFYLLLGVLRRRCALAGDGEAGSRAEWAVLLTAVLWAIAPAHGFTVPYVVQRMVLLSALFTLLSLHAYLSLRDAVATDSTRRTLGFGALMTAAAVLSLASKQTAILIPFYVAVIEVFLLRFAGLGRSRRLFLSTLWLAVFTPILVLAYTVWSNPAGIHAGYELRDFSPGERLLTQARVLVMYLRNIILPEYGQLYFFHDNLAISHSLTRPLTTAFSIAFLSGLALSGVLLRRRLPLLGFAVFWFLAGHSLESGPWSLEMVFWHRNYLPSIGPLLALACGLIWLIRKPGLTRKAGVGLTVLALAASALQGWLIANDWSNRIAIARAELIKNPGSARASHYYARMAVVHSEETHDPALLPEAAKFFSRAMEQDPDTLQPAFGQLYLAGEHHYGSLNDALIELKRRARHQRVAVSDEAVFQTLIRLHTRIPTRLDLFDALEVLDAALENPRLLPDQRAFALFNQGDVLRFQGMPPSVYLPYLRRAACIAPASIKYRLLLFKTLVDLGESDEAAALAGTGFSRLERLKDPSIATYEEKLTRLFAQRRDNQPDNAATPLGR